MTSYIDVSQIVLFTCLAIFCTETIFALYGSIRKQSIYVLIFVEYFYFSQLVSPIMIMLSLLGRL